MTEEIGMVIKPFNPGEESNMRAKAIDLCREYLHGAWFNVSPDQFVFRKVGGGLSNLLYYCSLPDGVQPIDKEPSQVLLRIYGPTQDGTSVLEAHLSECIVFTMLSENQTGPRLYGVFSGGRFEQVIPGRPLTTEELLDDELSLMIADVTAQLHKMTVPLSKRPTLMWNTQYRWLKEIEKYVEVSGSVGETAEIMRENNLRGEVTWLHSYLTSLNCPVVFCHNDLQEGNILLTKSQSLVLIDFEYCAYNYRAYDLANHFCEMLYDYSNDNPPYFFEKPHNFPTKQQQLRFIKRYLEKFENREAISNEEINGLMSEVQAFMLASHLFWAIWSFRTASSSSITFDYMSWGKKRLSSYLSHKETLFGSTKPTSPANKHFISSENVSITDEGS